MKRWQISAAAATTLVVAVVISIRAAEAVGEPLPLWRNGAPGARRNHTADVPTLTVYPADKSNSPAPAIVVCPGGGYGGLAAHEAEPIARWLNTLGVTGVVLKYRLGPRYHHPAMLQDAQRAIRTVRAKAG